MFNSKLKPIYLFIGAIGLFWLGCQKQNTVEPKPPQPKSEPEQVAQQTDSTVTILGKKLKNPYAVSNMRKAFEKVQADTAAGMIQVGDIPAFSTPVSHLYLKFIPKTQAELDILLSDSNLILYDYPLDHEIEQLGNYYRDPTIPDDQPTPQYCAVPVDYTLPTGVEHELLEPLFIPEEVYEEEWNNEVSTPTDTLIDRLVGHAMLLTGNIPSDTSAEVRNRKFCLWNCFDKWRPKGRIRVWDSGTRTVRGITGYRNEERIRVQCESEEEGGDPDDCTEEKYIVRIAIWGNVQVSNTWFGVEGVEVRARRWFTTHKGYANANGYYTCDGRFERKAKYSIKWARYDFRLVHNTKNESAIHPGPKKTGDWNVDFRAPYQQLYVIAFQAAHHYYYKKILDLRRPPTNHTWRKKLRIRIHHGDGDVAAKHSSRPPNIFENNVRRNLIQIWDNGFRNGTKTYSYIYGTTIHELAHASHAAIREKNFFDGKTQSKVVESWANGVEYALTRMVYPNYGEDSGSEIVINKSAYTGVVIDMIDANSAVNQGHEPAEGDRVEGYTIKQIEDVLHKTGTYGDWERHMFNDYFSNSTKNNLQTLFRSWW